MARPRSIYEQYTEAQLPPPDQRDRFHLVTEGETLMSVANKEYGLEEYDGNLWRAIAEANGVRDPFTFDRDYLGKTIRIPPRPAPTFD